jgi:hypothetical protein
MRAAKAENRLKWLLFGGRNEKTARLASQTGGLIAIRIVGALCLRPVHNSGGQFQA